MNKHKFRIPAALLALSLIAALSACGVLPAAGQNDPTVVPTVTGSTEVTAEGRIIPRDDTTLAFSLAGEVAEILVDEGQSVDQGEVLARLGNLEDLEAAVTTAEYERMSAEQALKDLNDTAGVSSSQAEQEAAAAENALIEARQALADLDTTAFQQDLDNAIVDVRDAEDDLEDAQEAFDDVADLDDDNQTRINAEDALEDAQEAYDQAVRDRDRLRNQLAQARADVELAEAHVADAQRIANKRAQGPDPDELALAQSRLASAEAQLASAQRALDDSQLTAPYAGTIVDIQVSANEWVTAGEPVMVFADDSQWYAETTDLTEIDVVRISQGQRVTVIPDAMPGLELSGVVESIARTYTERSGDTTYRTLIRLDDDADGLRWGMNVVVRFEE
jgi:multidrug resistance efflux pump